VAFPPDSVLPIGQRLKPPHGALAAAPARPVPADVDVAIIGAGVVGLSIGWRLAGRGLSVAIFDRGAAGDGTSLAATGMLAAAAEHEPGGELLLPLAVESQRLWPAFRTALEAESGIAIDYRGEGTLVVAQTRDEVARLRFRHDYQRRAGFDVEWLAGPEARRLEPGLRASVAAGLFCRGDHQVDPRLLVPALVQAFRARGGHLAEHCAVTAVETAGGHTAGVATAAGPCRTRTVIVAAGAWSAELLLPHGLDIPVRPLRGQALALRMTRQTGRLSHVVWTEQIHLAPKSDGRLIVGATMEDVGFSAAITAGGVLALLEGVHRALPSSEEMEIETVWSGFRPTTEDDAPVIGEAGIPGLLLATGHHRNGILLAPGTAAAIEELITMGALTAAAGPLGPGRFQPQPAEAMTMGVKR